MEAQMFKMRVPHDSKVRESFAPEFHLRQNSNNTTHLNDDANDSGINDHLTSARFNFPEENYDDDQQMKTNNNVQGSGVVNRNSLTPQNQNQQPNQLVQQSKYQKRNIELNDSSSNGKHNLNSNGNYNTQRTNQSNQTISEQFTNTVVKDRQVEDYPEYEEEEYQDENVQYHHSQNVNQPQKFQQQSHYNQILMQHHHQQQKELQQQSRLQNYSQKTNQLPQRLIMQDIQNQQQEQQLLHNQSQESMDYTDNISDLTGDDGENTNQNSSINARNGKMQQQQQRNYGNQMMQNKQQNLIGQKQNKVSMNANTNGVFAQKYGMHKHMEQQQLIQQQHQNDNMQQQPGKFFNYEDNTNCQQEMGEGDDYDSSFQHSSYINNQHQYQHQHPISSQHKYTQNIQPQKQQQQYPTYIKQANNKLPQQSGYPQTANQKIKAYTQDNSKMKNTTQVNGFNNQARNNQHHRRNLSSLNYMQHEQEQIEGDYSDGEVLTLSQGDEEEKMKLEEQAQKMQQLKQSQSLNNSHSGNNAKNMNNQRERYPLANSSLQQIDKHTIDEHSNNTSNNEEGIVNISSIKKKIVTSLNTPAQSSKCPPPTPPVPLRENSSSQNVKNQSDKATMQLEQKSDSLKNITQQQNSLQQNQNRKNIFFEDKENYHPYLSSSLNKGQKDQQGYAQTKGSVSPNSHTPQGNHSLQNSHNQIYSQQNQGNQIQNSNNRILDISADENIQDVSYSAFISGKKYFEDDFYSQNTSMIQQQANQQQNRYMPTTNTKLPVTQNNKINSQNQYQKKSNNNENSRFNEEQFDCNESNLNQLGNQYLCDEIEEQNKYYQEEYHHHHLQQEAHQIVKVPSTQQPVKPVYSNENKNNYQEQIKSANPHSYNNSNNNSYGVEQKQVKGGNKIAAAATTTTTTNSNLTSTTQSTSMTFQTQGFPRDSLGNKENIYNLCNLTSEGKRVNTLENKCKNKNTKDEKSHSDGEFEQIELEKILENQEDNQIFEESDEKEEQITNKALCESKNKGNIKTSSSSSHETSDGQTDNKGLNRSHQIFQPNKEEYNDIYNLLQHERNKNNTLEELLCSKSQKMLKFQKMIEQITKENEQLKSDVEEKDKRILILLKNIEDLEDIQRNNKESDMDQELLIHEHEKLIKQQKILQSENIEFLSQNRELVAENKQLIQHNNELQNNLKQRNDESSIAIENMTLQLEHQLNQLKATLNKKSKENELLSSQIEKVTAQKNEEIEHLRLSILNISSQDVAQISIKKQFYPLEGYQSSHNNNNNNQQQSQKQQFEKGSISDSINVSSVAIDTSFNQQNQGQPPRKINIPSSSTSSQQGYSKNQQSNKSINSGINGKTKNINSSNSNYNTICSHQSQDEANTSLNQPQNYNKVRSSSLSCKTSEHLYLQNSIHNNTVNTSFQQQQTQASHQHSGSFSHSNNSQQQFHKFNNQINDSSNEIEIKSNQQNSKIQNNQTFELLRILNLTQEMEIFGKVKEILDYNQSTKQFINCIINMVQTCAPSGYFSNDKPDLKQSWSVLKKIMNKYMTLKINSVKEQVDQELVNKIQSFLQITDKELIVDKITNLQTENQKLTRIILLVKKNFNLEWTKSLGELEKAIEMENYQNSNPNSKSFSGVKMDYLQPSQLTFNALSNQQLSQYSNSQINSKGLIKAQRQNNQKSSSSSPSPHMNGQQRKSVSPIQTQDYHIAQQQYQQQQVQVPLNGSTVSSQRIDSANSNHIVHHHLLI